MVVFFARFARLSGQTVEATGDLRNYTDAGSVSPYATEAMTWAVETGLIEGMTEHTLNPQGTSTRRRPLSILCSYCTMLG